MLNFLRRVNQVRPKPFHRLQRFLGIQEEWPIFKASIRPHKFKLLLLTTFAAYPLYKPYIKYYSTLFNIKLQASLQPDQPATQLIDSYAKHLIENVLRDPQLRKEGAVFIEDLSRRDVVLEAIVALLIKVAQNPKFLKETTGLTKRLTHEVLTDKELEQEAVALFGSLVQNPEIKGEMQAIIKWLCEQEGIRKILVDLCMDSFQQAKLLSAVKELMAAGFYDVLTEKETEEKLKLFSFYLLERDGPKNGKDKKGPKDKNGGKDQTELVSDKAAKGHQDENKESEFKRVLKGEGNEDVFESINERKKSTQPDEKDKKKFFSF